MVSEIIYEGPPIGFFDKNMLESINPLDSFRKIDGKAPTNALFLGRDLKEGKEISLGISFPLYGGVRMIYESQDRENIKVTLEGENSEKVNKLQKIIIDNHETLLAAEKKNSSCNNAPPQSTPSSYSSAIRSGYEKRE